jgi:hypothetical protein
MQEVEASAAKRDCSKKRKSAASELKQELDALEPMATVAQKSEALRSVRAPAVLIKGMKVTEYGNARGPWRAP